MPQYISLSEYAKLKNSTIDEVVSSAEEKKIMMPVDPAYMLNDAILKQLDPVFHHNMKYSRAKSAAKQTPDLKIVKKMIWMFVMSKKVHQINR